MIMITGGMGFLAGSMAKLMCEQGQESLLTVYKQKELAPFLELRRHGVDAALVAGSASSLYGLGAPPAEPRGWRVDIRDSERRGPRVAEVHLRDSSLTTSGTGEQCFWSGGTLYSDILDPRTGWPLQSITQVSVWAPKAVEGEVWAKACLLNGPEWVAGRKPDTVKVLTGP